MNQKKLQCGYRLLHFPLSAGHTVFFYRLSCIFSVSALSSSVHMIADVRITGALFLLFGHLLTACVPCCCPFTINRFLYCSGGVSSSYHMNLMVFVCVVLNFWY